MERDFETLYGGLCQQAEIIVSGMLQGFGYVVCKEVAHDVTVDFLFYSSSYQKVYDESRDIKPFFNAYVRLRVRRYRERLQKGRYAVMLTDHCVVSDSCLVTDGGVLQFEAQDFARAMAKCLEDRIFYWQKHSIDLHDLFLASLQSWQEKGKSNLTWIAKRLGYEKAVVERALISMREILRERFESESQDIHISHQRAG